MHVSIVRPDQPSDRVDLCVVVDVLRATTTAVVLCHRFGRVRVVRSLDDLDQLPAHPVGHVMFSELAARPDLAIPHFDNSPVLARDVELDGRMPVLVTTNGTVAIDLAARFAHEVVLAAFVNLSAVVDYVRRCGVATVAVMPAGHVQQAERCVEDDGCAAAIAGELQVAPLDVTAVIASCRAEPRILQRATRIAADVELCFAVDTIPVVPRVTPISNQRWFELCG